MSDARLSEFARRYFRMIGAAVSVDLPDFMEVDLPEEWRRWFDGRARLALAFSREALADHGDAQRLTHGARVLEQMAASLAERGDLVIGALAGGGEIGWPRITGAVATGGEPRGSEGVALAVWYRVTLVADEAREELVPVAVGEGLPESVVERFAVAMAEGVPAGWVAGGSADGNAPALFERARERLAATIGDRVARFRAEKEAAREEAIARLRLHHEAERAELSRLTSDGAKQQLARLPETMMRRVDEERDTYHVRVKATPLAAALARVSYVEQCVRWETLDGAVVEHDLSACPALDAVAHVACRACGLAIDDGIVCVAGARAGDAGEPARLAHLAHSACEARCGSCSAAACRACLPARCLLDKSCDALLCAWCGRGCATCHRPTCAAHGASCGVCRAAGCHEHVAACAFCRAPTCLACRESDLPVAGGLIAGAGECSACRGLAGGGDGIAGTRRVVPVAGWLGGRIEVHDTESGELVLRSWVPPWRSWRDRRFRRR